MWALTQLGDSLKEEDFQGLPQLVRDKQGMPLAKIARYKMSLTKKWKPKHYLLEIGEEGSFSIQSFQFLQMLLRGCPNVYFEESGFTRVIVTGRSHDGGVDGTGVLRVNLLSFYVLFQCKRWKGTVGRE